MPSRRVGQVKHGVVECVYEASANAADHKSLAENAGSSGNVF